jgi:hypothetical protein
MDRMRADAAREREELGLGPLCLGGGRALLGCGPRRLDFGLGCGGVAEGGDGAGEPVGDARQLARQLGVPVTTDPSAPPRRPVS